MKKQTKLKCNPGIAHPALGQKYSLFGFRCLKKEARMYAQVQFLLSRRHPLYLIAQLSPVIRLQFRILDSLLTPVLMQAADVVLALLEVDEFVPDAFLDEHAPRVLLHD